MLTLFLALMDEQSDREKFTQLYNLHKQKMWYAARKILNDDQLAEDAVHDAFIGIAKNIGSIKEVSSPSAAAYTVTAAKNCALSLLRKSVPSGTADISEMFDISDDSASDDFERIETEEFVRSVLLKMPETYRDVLYYFFVENMSEKEIAQLLSRNINTVRQQVFRGRKFFKEQIKKGEKRNGKI